MKRNSLDPFLSEFLRDPIGGAIVKAIRLEYLAGVSTFSVGFLTKIAGRTDGCAVTAGPARARLQQLVDNGYVEALRGRRYKARALFIGSGGVLFYQSVPPLYGRRPDEMIWLTAVDDDSYALRLKSARAMADGDFQQARKLLLRLLDVGARLVRGEAYHHLANLEAQAGDNERAEFCFDTALRQGARSEFLYADFAQFRARNGDIPRAIQILEQGVASQKRSSAIHSLLGKYYATLGHTQKSEHHQTMMMEAQSGYLPLKAAMADKLAGQGDYQGAFALYKQSVRSARRHCYPLYRMAYIHANMLGQAERAMPLFQKIMKIQPTDEHARLCIEKLKKGEAPLDEVIECRFGKRALVWRPERPGVIELAPDRGAGI